MESSARAHLRLRSSGEIPSVFRLTPRLCVGPSARGLTFPVRVALRATFVGNLSYRWFRQQGLSGKRCSW